MLRPIRVTAAAMLLALVVAAPARAQEIDPGFRADIDKLLDVTNATAMGVQMATLLSNQLIDGLRLQQPQMPQRAGDVIKEVLTTEFARMFEGPDGIRGDVIRSYASHFTHEEVGALLAFYSTDLGRKAIAVMPQLSQEGAAAGQKWAVANAPRILETVQQRLRAEGLVK